jgi:hypothetical protein
MLTLYAALKRRSSTSPHTPPRFDRKHYSDSEIDFFFL